MKYKYIVLTTITFTLFLIFIILINQYLKDISKDKLGSFPYKPDLSMFGEANNEYFQILEISNNITPFANIVTQYNKENSATLLENVFIKQFIEKNSNAIKMYDAFEFNEIIFPISIINDRNVINQINTFALFVRIRTEFESLNGNIDKAVSESIKANKIINQIIKKSPSTKFINLPTILKTNEISSLIKLINNGKTTPKQKLELLNLKHENITIRNAINYLYYLETYPEIIELDELKKLSNKYPIFKSMKLINPSLSYTYKPNKVLKDKRDFLIKVVELTQKNQLEDSKGLKIVYSDLKFKEVPEYKPDAIGNAITQHTKEKIYFLAEERIKIISYIKQLQIAKAILEFQEKNGSLPKNLNDLNLDSDILNNNLINKPFIYSAEIGILQRKENERARDFTSYIKANKFTSEETQELIDEFGNQLIIFK